MKFLVYFFSVIVYSNLCFAQEDSIYKATLDEIKLEAKPVYVKAYTDISELRNDVELAKQNRISKASVVKRFNELVGNTMGKLNSFNEVDKRLQKAGDAYITFMFDKEISRIARQRAAEASFDKKNK